MNKCWKVAWSGSFCTVRPGYLIMWCKWVVFVFNLISLPLLVSAVIWEHVIGLSIVWRGEVTEERTELFHDFTDNYFKKNHYCKIKPSSENFDLTTRVLDLQAANKHAICCWLGKISDAQSVVVRCRVVFEGKLLGVTVLLVHRRRRSSEINWCCEFVQYFPFQPL